MYASLFYGGGSVMGEARPELSAVHLKDAWERFNARMGRYFAQRTVQGYKDRHFGLCALLWLVILRAGLSYLPQFHLPYPCGRALRSVVVDPSARWGSEVPP